MGTRGPQGPIEPPDWSRVDLPNQVKEALMALESKQPLEKLESTSAQDKREDEKV